MKMSKKNFLNNTGFLAIFQNSKKFFLMKIEIIFFFRNRNSFYPILIFIYKLKFFKFLNVNGNPVLPKILAKFARLLIFNLTRNLCAEKRN